MSATMKLSRVAIAIALSVGLSTASMAQETSSSIRGIITNPSGQPAANVEVQVLHVPSGTVKTVITNDEGQYQASGLRVGGPYQLVLDSTEFKDTAVEGLFLSLGETLRFNQQLQVDSIEIISVTGTNQSFSNSSANDSYYGSEEILLAPSINRDIKDIIRNNPLVNVSPGGDRQVSIAGTNPRFNSISVGGIPLNDDFGLNGGGFPTQRNPFPVEALDQISVQVAPVNAKVSGFTGGNINAVFKSGTNEFHGSAFYELTNDSLTGTPVSNGVESELDFEEDTYGFSLGGPILQDKLFFYVAYEYFETPEQLAFGPAGSNVGSNASNITVQDVTAVQAIASDVYGLPNIGGFDVSPVLTDEKYIIKLDWNINEDHRADLVYLFNDGNSIRNTSSNSNELRLSTHWYNNPQELKNLQAKVYSNWSNEFSSEISITNKKVETGQTSFNSELGLGDISIQNVDSQNDGTDGTIAFGSDQFRHSNSLANDLFIIKADGNYLYGDHSIEFGFDYQILDVENQFLPGSKGIVTFNSLEDFAAREVSRYSYTNGIGNDPLVAAAAFQRENISVYVNDTWDFSSELILSFGLRYERFGSDDKPTFNQDVFDRTGFDNSFNLDGTDIILPRIGFTYFFNDDVTINGSIGRYAGGNPNVWISNSYSNDGLSAQSFSDRDFTAEANILTTPPTEAIDDINAATGSSVSNILDSDFDIPSQWTYLLNAEVRFDIPDVVEDISWTSSFLYIDKENTAEWVNAALNDDNVIGETSSGALPFYNTRELDILLTNADKDGRSFILSTGLAKNWDNGISVSTSYTYQDVTEGNPGTSSTARSNYRFGHFLDHQETQVGTSAFETKHRFVLNFGYETALYKDYKTKVNLFLERSAGAPYSHVVRLSNLTGGRFFDQDLIQPSGFGTTFGGNYTAYVPTANDPNVVYTGATEAEVLAYFDAAGLSGFAGGHVDKNVSNTPWTTRMDLSVRQELPAFMEDDSFEVYFVVRNLLNLIDSSAGKVYTQGNSSRTAIELDIDPSTGQYLFGDIQTDEFRFEAEDSTYQLKVGIEYRF
ncbi:MAG: hypothetical protein ACI9IT_001716 [Glaciecola sp.]|jgi:hypothetical protein